MLPNHVLQDVCLHGDAVILGVLQACSLHDITCQAISLQPDAAKQSRHCMQFCRYLCTPGPQSAQHHMSGHVTLARCSSAVQALHASPRNFMHSYAGMRSSASHQAEAGARAYIKLSSEGKAGPYPAAVLLDLPEDNDQDDAKHHQSASEGNDQDDHWYRQPALV